MDLCKKYNLYPSVMIAQAALESNWGRSELGKAPNYNLFGIKGSYNGKSVTMKTWEYSDSKGWYQINANFAKYPSHKESLEDNAKNLEMAQVGTLVITKVHGARMQKHTKMRLHGYRDVMQRTTHMLLS